MSMYLEHFGLREKPFSLTPDTQFYLNEQSHRDALNTMLVSLKHSEGFIKIVGEVGTGKTLLCRKLLSLLDDVYLTSYIPNPHLTPQELKAHVAREISAEVTHEMDTQQVMLAIYDRLLQLASLGRQVVLVIDEAQAMPRETIESLRLLTNLETEKRKLFQVVLLGQPELDDLLDRPDLRQLKQRIVFSEYLQPLTVAGTGQYLRHRLGLAGASRDLFTSAASWLLAHASGGVPRLVNVLAHKALLSAYGQGSLTVNSAHVASAVSDTPESAGFGKLLSLRWHLLWPVAGATSAAALVLVKNLGVIG